MNSDTRIVLAEPPEKILSSGDSLILSKEDTHHLIHVLRLSAGSEIDCVDPRQQLVYRAKLSATHSDRLELIIVELQEAETHLSIVQTLCPALLKGKHNDLVCEKAVELGVQRIIFWQADRSVVKLSGNSGKLERLTRIARAAAAQSKKNYLPEVLLADSIQTAFAKNSENLPVYYASLEDGAQDIRTLGKLSRPLWLFIGPEGDFSADEQSLFTDRNSTAISLGPSILRAETASIAALGMLHALSTF